MDLSTMLCIVTALLMIFLETEACSCSGRSLQQYYCDSDFVVKARVSNWTAESDSPMASSSYTLHIIKTYKMPASLRNETELEVHSVVSDGLCGINPGRPNYLGECVNPKRLFFITGSLDSNGQLWSKLCRNTYRMWRWLSKAKKRIIRNLENTTKC